MAEQAPVIRLSGVHKTYAQDGVEVHALRGIDLEVGQGDFVAIMGASGSGKSTLMHILGCLDVPDSGGYWLNGEDVTRLDGDALAAIRNHAVGFVFQSFNLLARTTALDNVEMPLVYAGVEKAQRRERAVAMLERLGLGERMQHLPSQLSGGQQQRVALARALVTRPALLLADEPTGNLDSTTSRDILRVLDELNLRDGLTIALITHEADVAAHARRQLTMCDGYLEE